MHESIVNLLSKFANSFDLKDWNGLEDTLMDNVECDYQDLRGKSETCSKCEYVTMRKSALNHLKTQHLFSNLDIEFKVGYATCQLSAVIYRQDDGGKRFDSHVIYNFHLRQMKSGEWKIEKIKQSVLFHEGDSSIHKGVLQ